MALPLTQPKDAALTAVAFVANETGTVGRTLASTAVAGTATTASIVAATTIFAPLPDRIHRLRTEDEEDGFIIISHARGLVTYFERTENGRGISRCFACWLLRRSSLQCILAQ